MARRGSAAPTAEPMTHFAPRHDSARDPSAFMRYSYASSSGNQSDGSESYPSRRPLPRPPPTNNDSYSSSSDHEHITVQDIDTAAHNDTSFGYQSDDSDVLRITRPLPPPPQRPPRLIPIQHTAKAEPNPNRSRDASGDSNLRLQTAELGPRGFLSPNFNFSDEPEDITPLARIENAMNFASSSSSSHRPLPQVPSSSSSSFSQLTSPCTIATGTSSNAPLIYYRQSEPNSPNSSDDDFPLRRRSERTERARVISDEVSAIYSEDFSRLSDYSYDSSYPLESTRLPDIYNYSEDAKEAIHNVVEAFSARPRLDEASDVAFREHCLTNAVMAVRHLLYVTGVLSTSLADFTLPSFYGSSEDLTNPALSELKPYKSKVAIRLTKLVTYAVKHNSAWSYAGSASRVESDANELEKAVSAFIQAQQWPGEVGLTCKRLYGLLGPGKDQLGLPGGGAAGQWKGMGFTSLEAGVQPPQRHFGREVLTELANLRLQAEDRLSFLEDIVSQDRPGVSTAEQHEFVVEWIVPAAQRSVAQLSSFLAHAEDINLAASIDIDVPDVDLGDIPEDIHVPRVGNNIHETRLLVRALEGSKQALYDDSAALLLATQDAIAASYRADDWSPALFREDPTYSTPLGVMDLILSSLRVHLEKLMDSFEFLLHIVQAEAEAVVADQELEMRNEGIRETERRIAAGSSAQPESDGQPRHTRPRSWRPPPIQVEQQNRTSTIPSVSVHEGATPWYLKLEHEDDLVLTSDGGVVKGGTLTALVERLTMHDNRDAIFNHTFLTTFKSFATVDETFDALLERFKISLPEGLTEQETLEWKQKKQAPIRIRVVNIFKSLVGQEDFLDKDDLPILNRIKAFAQDNMLEVPAAKQLIPIIERAQNSDYTRSITIHHSEPPPAVIQPKISKSGTIKLLDIDPVELARQLTLMESNLFSQIKKADCLSRAKDSTPDGVDSIKQVIATTNKIADWVTDSILRKNDSKRRANVIKHFILTAERCRNLQNFSSMAALISGLNRAPIKRLKRSWEHVNARLISQLDDLEQTLDAGKSFAAYKALLRTLEPPCVPFLGVYLTLLTFIHDGNKDFIVKDGRSLINFHKRQMTAEVIRAIKQYQSKPYNLTRVPAIGTFIEECFTSLDNPPDFWEISLEREPREREEYVMAKLLQESGFL